MDCYRILIALLTLALADARPGQRYGPHTDSLASSLQQMPNSCPHELWPLPRFRQCGSSAVVLSPTFSVQVADSSAPAARADPDLRAAALRCTRDALLEYEQYTRGADTEPVSSDDDGVSSAAPAAGTGNGVWTASNGSSPLLLDHLVVTVLGDDGCGPGAAAHKRLDSDEAYELRVDATAASAVATATLTAPTIWGAMYGLETFTQLVAYSSATGRHEIRNASVIIRDQPRFAWRGLMVDTANHFLPVSVLHDTIDAMAMNRMNTLHLHLVDSYSFPFASEALPLLAERGAWHRSSANPAPGMGSHEMRAHAALDTRQPRPFDRATYNASELRMLVAHGRARGVRIVPELDMPGHAYSWGLGYPDLVSDTCPDDLRNDLGAVNIVPVDPSSNATYRAIASLLSEYAAIFPDDFVHFGADEVQYPCWNNSATIQEYMRREGLHTLNELEAHFWSRVRADQAGANVHTGASRRTRSAVFWEEALQRVPRSLEQVDVVEVWANRSLLQTALDAGQRVLLADGWYLDRQVPVDSKEGWFWLDTWRHMYSVEPTAGIHLTPAQEALILGGEACMWSEQVDATSFPSRVWPKACAVAERLWSAKNVTDIADASARLMVHRCRMSAKGSPVGPVWADTCAIRISA